MLGSKAGWGARLVGEQGWLRSKAGWGARLVREQGWLGARLFGEQGRKIKQIHNILELASFERQRRLMFKRITA